MSKYSSDICTPGSSFQVCKICAFSPKKKQLPKGRNFDISQKILVFPYMIHLFSGPEFLFRDVSSFHAGKVAGCVNGHAQLVCPGRKEPRACSLRWRGGDRVLPS